MDLLKTILVYMSLVFASAVYAAPEPTLPPPVTAAPSVAAATLSPTLTPGPSTPKPSPVPTPNITPNNAYKTMKVGDNGENVREMQRRLAELGYYSGENDGRFGNQTRRAVERFQYNNGLSADGIAGKRTLTVLFESEEAVAYTPTDTATPAPGITTVPPSTPTLAPPASTTQAPTFVPTQTPAPLETEPVTTAESHTEPVTTVPPPEPVIAEPVYTLLEGVGFVLENEAEPLALASQAGAEPAMLAALSKDGQSTLVPLLEILRGAGVTLVPSIGEGHAEYAFALLRDFYHLSYDVDENGAVSALAISVNGQPRVMVDREAIILDGVVYLPLLEVEEWTGIIFALNEDTMMYTVFLPAEES